MKHIHPHDLGLALGLFMASWHVVWASLIGFGGAQWLLDFIFRLHMITPVYTVSAFDWGTAVGLVIITGLIGYVGGFLLALVVNRVFGV